MCFQIYFQASLTLSRRKFPCHIKTSPLFLSANQCTGFYMIGTTMMKELIKIIEMFTNLKKHIVSVL